MTSKADFTTCRKLLRYLNTEITLLGRGAVSDREWGHPKAADKKDRTATVPLPCTLTHWRALSCTPKGRRRRMAERQRRTAVRDHRGNP